MCIYGVGILGKPISIAVIQIHAPTTETEEDEIENFYTAIQEEIESTPKQEMLINIGNWSTKVENKEESNVFRKLALGVRHKVEDWLMDLCEAKNFSTANTCFKQVNRRLYTQTSPEIKLHIWEQEMEKLYFFCQNKTRNRLWD